MVVSLTEKMIRKCFGGKEKKKTAKKSNFKTKVLSAFFRHMVGKTECETCAPLAAVLGTLSRN